MNIRRSLFFFLVMLLISLCGILLLAEKPIMESIHMLYGVPDGCDWEIVGAGGSRVAAVAGWRNGTLVLRYFSTEGGLLSEQSVDLPEELYGGNVARLLPVREGQAYLGIYGPNAERLFLYRVGTDGDTERLLAADCPGDSSQERMERTALSELSYEDGVLAFALKADRALSRYLCREEGGLEAAGKATLGDMPALSILSAQNGTLLVGGAGYLSVNGRLLSSGFGDQAVTRLTYGRGGWYYLDTMTLEVCFVDAAFGATQRMLTLDTTWKGQTRSLRSAALTREESALMLLDGSVLLLAGGEGTRELTGILRPRDLSLWLGLGKYLLFALLAAAVLWLLFCGLKRGYASLVIFRGGLFIALALLCNVILSLFFLQPIQRDAALGEKEAVASGVLRTVSADSRMGEDDLPLDACRVLEGNDAESARNVRAVAAEYAEGQWRLSDGRLAVTAEGFDPALAEKAHYLAPVPEEGEEAAQAEDETDENETDAEPEEPAIPVDYASTLRNGVFRYVRVVGDRCLSVSMEVPAVYRGQEASRVVLISFGILACLVLLMLFSLGTDIRMISKKMESIARGSVPEKLELHSGDELESMASMVNSLGQSLRQQETERENVEWSYRRFVPEKVLALLGKQSIQEVDKSAFAARRMAVMTVWFTFPEALYTDMANSRLLFDSVNEVIERMASIVTRKGGTVFHFAYNGFDVVMDEGSEAVSTAVAIQQEVLGFNELRAQNGLPAVTLRIALDKGNVMLGIVGDTAQMEPTTISSSLSTAQELIDLCNRLKAGILCTEAIIDQRQDYGSRYMGKCLVGDQPVRVYEVFDGDEYGVRRGKSGSMRDFSRGVYDLYGGDPTSAKRIFLQLAHNYPQDGGVRYYLYLADRLEHDPSLPCVLNVDKRGEM